VLAAREGSDVGLFACSPTAGPVVALATSASGRSRYPAISPDGRWLAYSRYQGGNWQLRVAELETGAERTLTHSDCNSISPAWEFDSRRVVYATDCGRGVGDTTLARISAVP
jgi:Tol biopolymer transport system component